MSFSIQLEVPEHIRALVPYPPGKPIEETEREYGIKGVIKLASNENPLGPSPKAVEAISKAMASLQLYPDGSHFQLKQKLAAELGCTAQELVIGNGSNEHIDLLCRVFVAKNRNVVSHKGAFVAYKLCAQLQGCGFKEAQISTADLTVSVDDILAQVDSNTRLVFLANPNNPTGTFVSADDVERLAAALKSKNILLALDYAYWEYVDEPSIPDPMEVYRKHENVLILRTFSKIYGLGGLRVGYMIARPEIASLVERARQPFNVSSLALAGAVAALDDIEHVRKSVELNRHGKKWLIEQLSQFDVRVYPSQGNFLLVDAKQDFKELNAEFLKRGVILRPMANYGFPTFFRVTIGLETENKKFIAALNEVLF